MTAQLLEHGADAGPHMVNSKGKTTLMVAAGAGQEV